MRTYENAQELKEEISAAFRKYIAEFDDIPEALKDKRIDEVERTPAENLAYQVGWTTLLLQWEDRERRGLPVRTPSDEFKWNQLGKLYRWFNDTYAHLSLRELEGMLTDNVDAIYMMIDAMSEDELFKPHMRQWADDATKTAVWEVYRFIHVNTVARSDRSGRRSASGSGWPYRFGAARNPFVQFVYAPMINAGGVTRWAGALIGSIVLSAGFMAACSLSEAVTERYSRKFNFEYGQSRAWGSFSYAIVALCAGFLFNISPMINFWIGTACGVGMLLIYLFWVPAEQKEELKKEADPNAEKTNPSFKEMVGVLKMPTLWVLIVFMLLTNTFYTDKQLRQMEAAKA